MKIPESLQDIIDVINKIVSTTLFQINDFHFTIGHIVKFVLIILVLIVLTKLFNRHILRRILRRFEIEDAVQYSMLRVSQYILTVIVVIIALQSIGFDLTGLTVVFGMLSVGIGFGLQNITSNFISGIILLFERPINIGDRVTVGDIIGRVDAINMRAT
ncbi:MAG: mechanosensitive ion channel domain-containing protein, partial [bacterium]